MASSSSPRLGRSRRRSRKSPPCVEMAAVFVTITLVLLGLRMDTDGGADNARNAPAPMTRQQRCQETCSAVVFEAMKTLSERHEDLPVASHAALAASAVSALLHVPNPSGTRANTRTDDSILAPYPNSRVLDRRRLPPLLEKLVGSAERLSLVEEDVSHRDVRTRTKNAHARPNTANLDDVVQRGTQRRLSSLDDGRGETDDSVAVVAAAAAAAIFSRRDPYDRGHGRLRMKSYNDQWEAALRWVASWDDATLRNRTHSNRNTPSSSQTHRRKKRIKPSSSSPPVDKHMQRHDPFNQTKLHSLYETCRHKCIRDSGDITTSTARKTNTPVNWDRKIQHKGHRLQRFALNHVYKLAHRGLPAFWQGGRFSLLGGIVGLIISSSLILSRFHTAFWWKKHNSSILQANDNSWNHLLLDTQSEDTITARHKKAFNKKSKRKKSNLKDNTRIKALSSGGVASGTHTISKAADEEETIDSDDSYDLTHLRDLRSQAKLVSRISVDDTSMGPARTRTEHTGSTTSYSTDDTDSQIITSSVSHYAHGTCDTQPPRNQVSESIERKMECIPGSLQGNGSTSLDPLHTLRPCLPSTLLTDSGQNFNQSCHTKVKVEIREQVIDQPQLVPTDEQREEAARKLREFQEIQIRKIIDQREARRLQEQQMKRGCGHDSTQDMNRSPINQIKTSTALGAPPSVEPSLNTSLSGRLFPNVTKAKSEQVLISPSKAMVDEGDRDNLLDEISRESFLLKSMLDEDDEELNSTGMNYSSPLHVSMKRNGLVDEIAESPDSLSSLRIPAVSFSPSWVNGDHSERRIW